MFYIKSIKIGNFRCYSDYYQEFSPKINIIIGENAVGKTSLIEAVYALGLTKSHKTSNDYEMIKKGEEYCFIKGSFFDGQEDNVTCSITSKGKQIIKNDKKVGQISKYIGFYNVVMFCPEDLELINGAPIAKRRFLDINICQIDPIYLDALSKYKRLLKERNQLLKDIKEDLGKYKDLLDVITNKLIEEAKIIIKHRRDFINKLSIFFKKQVEFISSHKEEATLEYEPSCNEDNLELESKNKEKLDLITKTTNWGPHRDDFRIVFNGMGSELASQGQQKTFALALKLALIDILKEKSNRIIVILDDVFGELDVIRQKEIIKIIEMEYQIFITTTSIDYLDSDVLRNSNIIKIERLSE